MVAQTNDWSGRKLIHKLFDMPYKQTSPCINGLILTNFDQFWSRGLKYLTE